jgi:glycosyltransferase involved in cell wall biosynthesis
VLHVLSQQPGKTGSGIYLQALVRQAAQDGLRQRVIVGIPDRSPLPAIPPLEGRQIGVVRFGTPTLPYPVAGMSDVMPYESTRFSQFTPEMLEQYLSAFQTVLLKVVAEFNPHVIHTHHLWLVTALTRELFPDIPVVTTCHGTEFRQLELAPALATFVLPGCSGVDRAMALHRNHRDRIGTLYGIGWDRIVLAGAGYREDLFCPPGAAACLGEDPECLTIVYAGKISSAKGLPWLINALDQVELPAGRRVRLLVAGSGAGEESDAIRQHAAGRSDRITFLGPLPQEELAALLQASDIFVLPSFYEGLPLVILEAIACCCRVVVTDLPGMDDWLPQDLDAKGIVERVPLPRLCGPDTPEPDDLPAFTIELAAALSRQLRRCTREEPDWREDVLCRIESMNWQGIYRKVKAVYLDVLS